jgi:hypothetical protein
MYACHSHTVPDLHSEPVQAQQEIPQAAGCIWRRTGHVGKQSDQSSGEGKRINIQSRGSDRGTDIAKKSKKWSYAYPSLIEIIKSCGVDQRCIKLQAPPSIDCPINYTSREVFDACVGD